MNPFGNHFRGRINFTAGRRQKLGEFQQLRNYLLKGIGMHDVLGHLPSIPKEGLEKQNPGVLAIMAYTGRLRPKGVPFFQASGI